MTLPDMKLPDIKLPDIKLRRMIGWEARLAAEIERARSRVFDWGVFDCALFAADCALAMTGDDPADVFRGKYKTARGAYGQLRRFAGLGPGVTPDAALEATLTKICGAVHAPAFGRRGDAATVATPSGLAAGVIGLDGTVVHAVGPATGFVDLPRAAALRCWRVG